MSCFRFIIHIFVIDRLKRDGYNLSNALRFYTLTPGTSSGFLPSTDFLNMKMYLYKQDLYDIIFQSRKYAKHVCVIIINS